MKPLVVLYNPRAPFHTLPLGLLAVGSALDRSRCEVRIVDGRLEPDPLDTLRPLLGRALCLGISVLTGRPIADALRVSRAAKAFRPDLPVIWGGWHPSLFPAECLAEPSVDAVVQAQGELTFAEIVARLADGRGLDGVLGCAHRTRARADGSAHTAATPGPTTAPTGAASDVAAGARASARRPRPAIASSPADLGDAAIIVEAPRPMADANDLPPHDYRLLDLQRYFSAKGRRQLDYITSYGCYFRCAFCADPFVYGRRWTGLAPERIVNEILPLCKQHGIVDVNFQDETFFTYADRVDELARRLIAAGRPFSWAATLRADQACRMSDAQFARCARSGLRRVLVGVESGSQAMLDWMKKDITLEQVFETAERCRRHGIAAQFPFIVGFPGEPPESVTASLDAAKRLRAMSPSFETPIFFFKPYPGSPITDAAIRDGYRLPDTLEGWSDFEIHARGGPWVDPSVQRRIERFGYYASLAWGEAPAWKRPLAALARWRCRRDRYELPWELWVSRATRRRPALS